MARINKSDVIQKAVNDLALSQSGEKIPSETLDKVQLTYSLNKQFSSFLTSTTQLTTGALAQSFPSVSAGGEIYLTGITATFAKDATCDLATGTLSLSVTPNDSNVAKEILRFAVIALTADSQTQVISLPYPLKIKPGSSLSMSGSFTVGVLARAYTATGFITSSN